MHSQTSAWTCILWPQFTITLFCVGVFVLALHTSRKVNYSTLNILKTIHSVQCFCEAAVQMQTSIYKIYFPFSLQLPTHFCLESLQSSCDLHRCRSQCFSTCQLQTKSFIFCLRIWIQPQGKTCTWPISTVAFKQQTFVYCCSIDLQSGNDE